MKKVKYILMLLPLILGVMIYLLYRSKKLFYYNLIHFLDINGYVLLARELATIYRKLFPTWAIYSLPDGLWLFSTGAAFLIFRNRYFIHFIWFTFIYFIMIGTEYLQKFYGGHGTAIGTYDKQDIYFFSIAYVSIVLISFILRKFQNKFLNNSNIYIEIFENIQYTIIFFIIGILPSMFKI